MTFPAATVTVARPDTPAPDRVATALTCAGHEKPAAYEIFAVPPLTLILAGTPAAAGFLLSTAKWTIQVFWWAYRSPLELTAMSFAPRSAQIRSESSGDCAHDINPGDSCTFRLELTLDVQSWQPAAPDP